MVEHISVWRDNSKSETAKDVFRRPGYFSLDIAIIRTFPEIMFGIQSKVLLTEAIEKEKKFIDYHGYSFLFDEVVWGNPVPVYKVKIKEIQIDSTIYKDEISFERE